MQFKYSLFQGINAAILPRQSFIPGSGSSLIKIIQNGVNNKYLMALFLQLLENQFWRAPGCEQWWNYEINHFPLEPKRKLLAPWTGIKVAIWDHIRPPPKKAAVFHTCCVPERWCREETSLRAEYALYQIKTHLKRVCIKRCWEQNHLASLKWHSSCRSRWKWLWAKAGLRQLV